MRIGQNRIGQTLEARCRMVVPSPPPPPFSVCVFICVRLTSVFSLPFVSSPRNGEPVEKRKETTERKKEEHARTISVEERPIEKGVFVSPLSSLSLSLLSLFCSVSPVTKHRSFTLNYQSSFWLKPVSRLCEPNRPGCSWLGSRKDKGLLRNPRCA